MAKITMRPTYMRTGQPSFTFASIDIVLAEGQRVGGTNYREGVRVDVLLGRGDDELPIFSEQAPTAAIKEKAIKVLQDALRELRRWSE